MTKKEFAAKLYAQLLKDKEIQSVTDSIKGATRNGEPLSIEEQLEILKLIREINIESTKGLFESVDGFLALVSAVETQIKLQSSSSSEDGGSNNNNGNK